MATTAATKPIGAPSVVLHIEECKGCGRCVVACPKGCLAMGCEFNARGFFFVHLEKDGCVGFGACFYACPEPHAVEVHLPPAKTVAKV